MIKKKKVDKKFVSDIDVFLQTFDKQSSPSASQQKEINKHQRIFRLRDDSSLKGECEE